ncbi:hypothetical protein M427DRAFT_338008 [Gonapodya prolifera JEL478]|uniref:Uncharacterized protein n=1 Tax=Gonapodya prolifera (strain JEL478) TaxID=1344416 RepID=A0A139AD87_GONPJ|nr:hypothetical protein M427DRAFT_338008 [Gonapodya prolifera JEL478]|eukprot:KXS14761.1 hypothetical protein M427DRAFT_338008 [Gonapodya prolifera JEL478]
MAGEESQLRKRKGDKKSSVDADKAANDSPSAPSPTPHVVTAPSPAFPIQPQVILYAVLITFTGLYFHWLASVYSGFDVPNSTPRQSTFANPLTSLLPASVPCPANAVCDDQWSITKCASDWFDLGLTSIQKTLSWPPGSPPGQSTVLLPPPLDHPQCFFNTTKYTHLKLDFYGDEHLAALGRDSENYMRKMGGIVECHASDPNVDEGISKGTNVVRWYEADLAKRIPRAYGFPVSFADLQSDVLVVYGGFEN